MSVGFLGSSHLEFRIRTVVFCKVYTFMLIYALSCIIMSVKYLQMPDIYVYSTAVRVDRFGLIAWLVLT